MKEIIFESIFPPDLAFGEAKRSRCRMPYSPGNPRHDRLHSGGVKDDPQKIEEGKEGEQIKITGERETSTRETN